MYQVIVSSAYLFCIKDVQMNSNIQFLVENADRFTNSGMYAEAMKTLQDAISLDSRFPPIYCSMGGLYLHMGNFPSAIQCYQQAIQLVVNPEYARPFLSICWCCMGYAYYKLENYNMSWEANKMAADLYSFPTPIINLAAFQAKAGNKAEMVRFLEYGIPLINPMVDGSLINFMETEDNFEEYRDVVLNLLKTHGKIHKFDYERCMEAWMKRRHSRHTTQIGVVNINQGNVTHEGMKIDQRWAQLSGSNFVEGNNYGSINGSINDHKPSGRTSAPQQTIFQRLGVLLDKIAEK
jgi:tetratricopeptide (TPR) repeat protein